MAWYNVDLRGRHKGGAPDLRKLSLGDNPQHLARYAVQNITDCYLREIGRHPTQRELELTFSAAVRKESSPPFDMERDPTSEIL